MVAPVTKRCHGAVGSSLPALSGPQFEKVMVLGEIIRSSDCASMDLHKTETENSRPSTTLPNRESNKISGGTARVRGGRLTPKLRTFGRVSR